MADAKISALTSYTNPDAANDVIPIVDTANTTTKKITRNAYLGITGAPVGTTDTQTLTNKTLTAPTITSPILSGTITGTYTLAGTPTFPSTVVTLTGSQTLTNKTLTSPTISAPTITNASITADAITGFTTANTGTIYGVPVTAGTIAGTSLTAGTVGGTQLSTSAITLGFASIATNFTTTTVNAYVDVTGLSTTVTVPAGGRNLEIIVFLSGINSGATAGTAITCAIRESTTVLTQTVTNLAVASFSYTPYVVAYVAAPSAGSHTYKFSVAQNAAGTLLVGANTAGSTTAFSSSFILVKAI